MGCADPACLVLHGFDGALGQLRRWFVFMETKFVCFRTLRCTLGPTKLKWNLSLGVEGGSLWLVTSSSLIVVILPAWGRGLRLFLNSSESVLICVCTIFACREEGIVEIMQYLWIRRVVSLNKISLLLSTHFLSSFFSIWAFNANDSGIIFTALPRSSGALLSLLYRWRTEVQTEIKWLDNTRSWTLRHLSHEIIFSILSLILRIFSYVLTSTTN